MGSKPKSNICFDCSRACGGCPWSARFEPVPGWTAEPVLLNVWNGHSKEHFAKTYHITACPLFTKDRDRKKRKRGSAKGEMTKEQLDLYIKRCARKGEF